MYLSISDEVIPIAFRKNVTPINNNIKMIIFPVVLFRDKRESFVTLEAIIAPSLLRLMIRNQTDNLLSVVN